MPKKLLLLTYLLVMFTSHTWAYDTIDLSALGVRTNLQLRDWSMSSSERFLHGLHVIDAVQTYKGPASEEYYTEVNPLGKAMMGGKENPDKSAVVLWAVVSVPLYHYTFQLIDHSDLPKWARYALKGGLIAGKFYVVGKNHKVGIRLYGQHRKHH